VRILYGHNFYQQPGGEDRCYHDEVQLLRDHGHEVITYTQHNRSVPRIGRLRLAGGTIWSRRAYREVRALVARHRPQVAYFANTFPLISPSAYYAARHGQAAVVQVLHNFRLACPRADLLRDGRPCELCVGRLAPWPAIRHACYRESRAATAVTAGMLAVHRWLETWSACVDLFCALTPFARGLFLRAGLDRDQLVVKPNFVATDLGMAPGSPNRVLFVGRLAPEKGVSTLLDAWARVPGDVELHVAGDGPLATEVRRAAGDDRRIRWHGLLSHDQVLTLMGSAAILVMPSLCYEAFGLPIIEAYSRGTPVVASRHGSMAELVDEGSTGWLSRPGDADRLATTLARVLSDPSALARARERARRKFERCYGADRGYANLLSVLERARRRRQGALVGDGR
jgi:glycosyltransferase involved in cell wall biosynthesis